MKSKNTKPTLVMLHGWGLSKNTWRSLIPELTKAFNVHTLDLFGFGGNQGHYKVFTLDNYIQQIKDFLEEEKIRRCILLGHSFGGSLAVIFTAENPEKVDKLILYSSSSPFTNNAQGVMHTLRKLFGRLLVLIFSIIQRGLRNKKLTFKDIQQLSKIYYGIKGRYTLVTLNKIKKPVLIIAGKFDLLVPLAFNKKLQSSLSHSHLVVFDKSTHVAHKEEKKKFIETLKEFSNS